MDFFAELKRRNVIRVAIAYTIVGWVVAQVAEFAFEAFGAPDWVLKSVVVILLLGLPLAIVFAWAFELTPEGIKLERDVDRSKSITTQTGRKLDRVIIVVLLGAVGWFAWDKFVDSEDVAGSVAQTGGSESAAGSQSARTGSVAVLPFVAMSSGDDDEYFADGLTEEILNSLAQLPELLVTARTSAFSFKNTDLPVQQIAETLGVQNIVEGSVRRSGERLRVTAQLIRASDGFHLWSENYDSESADTIAVQENIAEKIAEALNVVLDDGKRAAMRDVGMRDVEAFVLYQKGLDYYDRAHGNMNIFEGLRRANEYFDQVIELVPDYWEVYTVRSDIYVHALNNESVDGDTGDLTAEELATAYSRVIADYDSAIRYARTAQARDAAELGLAYLSANWRGINGRLEQALAHPGCREPAWASVIATLLDQSDAYLQKARTVIACDPLRSSSWYNATRAANWAGDVDEALRLGREGTRTAPGTWLTAAYVKAMVASGAYDDALREVETRMPDPQIATVLRALIAASQGDTATAEQAIADYRDTVGFGNYYLISMYAWLGRRDESSRLAARVDQHPNGPLSLWQTMTFCECGAAWDLAATPNFAAKIAEANIPWPTPSPLTFPLKDW